MHIGLKIQIYIIFCYLFEVLLENCNWVAAPGLLHFTSGIFWLLPVGFSRCKCSNYPLIIKTVRLIGTVQQNVFGPQFSNVNMEILKYFKTVR